MHAVTIVDGTLHWKERPDPEPGAGEVLVAVRSAGLNAADLLQLAGFYPAPPGSPPDVPGMEFAGEVVALGPGATRYRVGDRVMAVVGGGAQAELAVVHERCAIRVPDALDPVAAGGFPEAFTTAHDAVFTQAQLGVGESLCVHGAAGGVGVAAVQLGVAAGARVVGTVRNPALRDRVAELGATAVETEGFGQHGPFDVVLELIGGPNLREDISSLAIGGRIAIIGVGGGPKAEISLLDLMAVRGRIHGSTLRARPLEQKAAAAAAVDRHVLPLVDRGLATVPVEATFPMAEAAAAYEHFRAGGKFGKVVLTSEA
ncbi:alcohol dehydrogenase catalytic domain-containing protein [Dermatobacter hominis]|uniref:alcohol dehydrogenase catalytic domain-containing protein n=1 Tax=Dermatobacter hominis TaxID=2884263 RepID=UPI001D0F90D4|nr:zinc-binding dehydrogenase [Dermatobacter hominis]UDY34126.1 zinc-binding dehydrogenase [Dermatobacter hominis]